MGLKIDIPRRGTAIVRSAEQPMWLFSDPADRKKLYLV